MTYFASKASANTPAASGAAAEVPECVFVHLPYRSVVAYSARHEISATVFPSNTLLRTTPVWGSLAPLLKVDASVLEQDSS